MKKIAIILMIVLVALSLAGCGTESKVEQTLDKFLQLEKEGNYMEARKMLTGVLMAEDVKDIDPLNHALYGRIEVVGDKKVEKLDGDNYKISFTAKIPEYKAVYQVAVENKMSELLEKEPFPTEKEAYDIISKEVVNVLKSGNYAEDVKELTVLVERSEKEWKINVNEAYKIIKQINEEKQG